MTDHPSPDSESGAPPLFQKIDFTSHAGLALHWKIECDALTIEDWDGLAQMAVEILPPFGEVEGIPTGGIRFADALAPFATEGPLLIADDVLTTGGSMEQFRALHSRGAHTCFGVVAFARGACPDWVTPVLSISESSRV